RARAGPARTGPPHDREGPNLMTTSMAVNPQPNPKAAAPRDGEGRRRASAILAYLVSGVVWGWVARDIGVFLAVGLPMVVTLAFTRTARFRVAPWPTLWI